MFVVNFSGLRNDSKEWYKPFIGLDSCHLKGPSEGVSLSAITLNTN